MTRPSYFSNKFSIETLPTKGVLPLIRYKNFVIKPGQNAHIQLMAKNISVGYIVYIIRPGCTKLELECIDMYDKFNSTTEKYDFVSMLFLNINFKYL